MLNQIIRSLRTSETKTSEEQKERSNKLAYYKRIYYIKSTNNGGKDVILTGRGDRKLLNQRQKRKLRRRAA